jgi:uncharacterized OB-fold protein
MTTTMKDYPQPTRSDINAPLLDAWKKGELHLQQCRHCDCKVYFPRTQCPQCWSVDLHWKRLSGKGKVVSYARVHKHLHPSFDDESPTLIAEVLLDEGWSMLARIVTSAGTDITSGMRLELVSLEEARRYPLPTFCPQK